MTGIIKLAQSVWSQAKVSPFTRAMAFAVLLPGLFAMPVLAEKSPAEPYATVEADKVLATADVEQTVAQPAEYDLRLVDGTATEGRLEIYENDQWGTICDDLFDATDARVACGQLGLSGDASVLNSSPAGPPDFPILMDDVQCTGSESKLHDCPHTDQHDANCGHNEDVAIACVAPNNPPTGEVTISGTPENGQTLTAVTSSIADADGPETLTFTYQWLDHGRVIPGATGSTHKLTELNIGKRISVRVTYTDSLEKTHTLVSAQTAHVTGLCYGWTAPQGEVTNCGGAVQEGGKARVRVRLSNEGLSTIRDITRYRTHDVTAVAPGDYASKTGTLVIPVGQNGSQAEFIDVHIDGIDEPREIFVVSFVDESSMHHFASSTVWRVFAIQDGDAEPSLSVADASGPEDGTVDFEVALTSESGFIVSVEYATEDRTATQGSDYTATTGTLTFQPGEATKTVTVSPLDDAYSEGDETFTLTLSNPAKAVIDDGEATGTIQDNDGLVSSSIVLSADPMRISEGAGATSVMVTVALDGGALTTATTVAVSVAGSGNANAVGFAPVSDFDIEIAAGAASGSASFTLTPEDDAVDGPDETVTLSGAADLPVSPATVTLVDDDATSTGIALSAHPARVSEGAEATMVTVTAALDGGARTRAATVTVSLAGSGNANAVGFAPVSDFDIEIAAGAASGSASFTLTPEDDAVDGPDETVTLSGAADLPVSPATVTLVDDDATSTGIALSAHPARVSEGAEATMVTVTAALDGGARTRATTVTVSLAGSGNANAVGFAPVRDFDIEIAAGAASGSASFTLTPKDDAVDGPDETVTLSGASDLPVSPATVTLADDDAPSTAILLSAAPANVSEGAGATPVSVTATLNGGARTIATTVAVTATGTGAENVVGFAPVTDFEIVIGAGASSGSTTFTLTPADDNVASSNETLTVAGTANLDVIATAIEIADDDAESTGISLTTAPGLVSEGDGSVQVSVTASLNRAALTAAATVTVSLAGSGNANAVGFAPVRDFDIEIAAGDTSGGESFTLTPEDDAVDGPDETLTLSGTSNLPVSAATVTLADDDAASTAILLSAAPAIVSEGAGATTVTVTATLNAAARTTPTTVAVSVAGSGNTEAVDFSPVRDFEIAIAAGAISWVETFTLTPENDTNVESDETLSVSGASDLPVISTTVRLVDDDEAPTQVLLFLSAVPAQASEGGGPVRVTVTAQLDRGVRPNATGIVISVAGSGDPRAVDFAPVPDFQFTIPAQAPSGAGSFTVVLEDDQVVEADEVLTVSGVAALPVTPATITLLDDDEPGLLLSPTSLQVVEGDSAIYTVALAVEPSGPVTVTARAAGFDLDVTPMALAFTPGDWWSPQTVTLRAPRDADTADESATVVHRARGGSYESAEASLPVAILDEKTMPTGPLQVFRVLLFESAAHPLRQGFLRIVNHSPESGEVLIEATDDTGDRREPVTLAIDAGEAAHFNSDDLEQGNPEKGLSGGVGTPTEGEWRLKLSSPLDIEVLAYSRTTEGFVNAMHDNAPVEDGTHRVSFFNPGSNRDQLSLLRLINIGASDAVALIAGTDDAGVPSGEVQVDVAAGAAVTLSADELESGVGNDIASGALGDGMGKWRLTVTSASPLALKSVLANPSQDLTNLSTSPGTPGSAPGSLGIPLFPSMADPDREGVVRVINHSAEAGTVRMVAMDNTPHEYEAVTLALGTGEAAHFNSADLELGNTEKDLTGSTGAGEGPWRLDISSELNLEVLSYVRTKDGFLTAMHDVAAHFGWPAPGGVLQPGEQRQAG